MIAFINNNQIPLSPFLIYHLFLFLFLFFFVFVCARLFWEYWLCYSLDFCANALNSWAFEHAPHASRHVVKGEEMIPNPQHGLGVKQPAAFGAGIQASAQHMNKSTA